MGTMVLLTKKKDAVGVPSTRGRVRVSQVRAGVARPTSNAAPLLFAFLAACAAPVGTKATNPACVVYCAVTLQDSRVLEDTSLQLSVETRTKNRS